MEWVETTARSVEEAKELLLDQLGVDEPEAEFEVIEEPKPGLFGRTKGQARVRARVRPKTPATRDDRRRRPARGKKEGGGAKESTPKAAPAKESSAAEAPAAKERPKAEPRAERAPRPDRGGDDAADAGPRLASDVAEREAIEFLQGVVDRFGLEAAISGAVDESGDISVDITGSGLGRLIGPRGGVISALEELTRTRLQHVASGGSTPRFKLDVGGYRATRRDHLEILVDEVVEKVRSTGQAHVLDVVLAGERKLVHDRVAETAPDVTTHSEGEDPVRRVVLSPA
jgi:spoIIIJ-associated protein